MPDDHEDTTMPPQPTATETFPRIPRPRRAVDPSIQYAVGGAVVPEAETLNRLLDERDRAEDRRSGRAAASAVRTVREEAQRRAAVKLRHERHLEVIEVVRAYLVLAIIFGLLVIVVGAGVVGFGIIAGWFDWRPTHV